MTLNIEDRLAQLARAAAIAQGKTLEEFVAEAVQRALGEFDSPRTVERNGLQVMCVPTTAPTIDPDVVREHLEEEGI